MMGPFDLQLHYTHKLVLLLGKIRNHKEGHQTLTIIWNFSIRKKKHDMVKYVLKMQTKDRGFICEQCSDCCDYESGPGW